MNNNNTIYHTHHIIPRHMGGTNDPCNLIKLTVEEHAEAHRILYENHGFEEDRLDWLALSGQVSMSEIKKNETTYWTNKRCRKIKKYT